MLSQCPLNGGVFDLFSPGEFLGGKLFGAPPCLNEDT